MNTVYTRWGARKKTNELHIRLEKETDRIEQEKLKEKIRETRENSLNFRSTKPLKNGDWQETDKDDQLIKRSFMLANGLKTPPYYKQTALQKAM